MEKELKSKKPSAILTSDWHIRESIPICRTDNFWDAQWRKVDFVAGLQRKYHCPVLHAGDLFDHWKPSPYLLRETMEHLPNRFYTIYGQHDLPNHSLDLKNKSGISVLEAAEILETMDQCSWGQIPKDISSICIGHRDHRTLVWHDFTYLGKEPFPGAKGKAHAKLEKYKQFDLIVTGDNHQSFTSRGVEGNLLVNPGSLMRQDADQIDFQPKVYLWYAEDNTVEAVEIPIEKDVVTREHIEKVEQRDERIDAFVSRMDSNWELTTNFDENLERFFVLNRVRQQVKNIIWEHKSTTS